MTQHYKPIRRRIQRRKRRRRSSHPDDLQNPQLAGQNSSDQILHLQNTIGNQAVIQMMRGRDTEQTPPKQNPFPEGKFKIVQSPPINKVADKQVNRKLLSYTNLTIQRMPQVDEAQSAIPDSDAKDMRQRKLVVVNMIREFNRIYNGYPEGFPQTADEIRTGVAETYKKSVTQELISLVTGIHTSLRVMKEYFQARSGKKSSKKGKQKHQNRVQQLIQLINSIEMTREVPSMLNEIHHELTMAVMAGSQDMQFKTTQDLVGDVDKHAAKGGVHTLSKGQINTTQGVKTGYFKADDYESDEAGIGISIKAGEAKQSLRAVATYQISELLGMGVIPYTALTKSQDADGNVSTGQFMEEVQGFTGRGKILADELPADKAEKMGALLEELKSDDLTNQRRKEIRDETDNLLGLANAAIGTKEIDGKIYQLDHATADIDWMTPVIQKDLSTLQLFDMIIAHADRHPENYVIETGDNNEMTGVKGIDNDSVWGRKADADFLQKEGRFGWEFKAKTPGVPPVLDAEVALRVVSTPWAAIEGILSHYAMQSDEIVAAESRWNYIQEKVKDMILANQLATMGMEQGDQVFIYMDLYSAIGEPVPQDVIDKRMMIWGDETAEHMTVGNSYAGREQASDLGNGYVKPEDYE